MDIPHPINATGSRNRNHSLDVFRLISVFVIFLFHSEMHLSCNYYIFENFIKMGAIFMTAFFMLSGVVLSISGNDCDLDGVSIRISAEKNHTHNADLSDFENARFIDLFE